MKLSKSMKILCIDFVVQSYICFFSENLTLLMLIHIIRINFSICISYVDMWHGAKEGDDLTSKVNSTHVNYSTE